MIKYPIASPFFPKEDIPEILEKIKTILEGDSLLTRGPYVEELERLFASRVGTKYAIAVNSGASALELSLGSFLNPGDEVILPVETFVATANAVIRQGGKPIFAGINPKTFCLSFKEVQRLATKRTKAIIIVHFGGIITDEIWEIKKLCQQKGIYLIEDAAHAHGSMSQGVYSGNIGDAGCFSFFATKVLTTGEGGIITTNNRKIYEYAKSVRSHGIDVLSPTEIYNQVGTNSRMNEISALLGLAQLKHLNQFIAHRNTIAEIYDSNLEQYERKGLIYRIKSGKNTVSVCSYWRYIVRLKESINRVKIKQALLKKEIAVDWPYDPPLMLQPVFKSISNARDPHLSKTLEYLQYHICLPVHMSITPQDAQYIIKSFIKEIKKI